jgi:hypothetical protein
MLFSTANAFHRQEKEGLLNLLKEAALPPRNVKIRILIPADKMDTTGKEEAAVVTSTMTNQRILELKELGIDVRRTIWQQQKQQQQNFLQNDNNLMLLIADQSLSLTVELNEDDDTKEEASEEDAIGLATYSNSEATVFAYTSIFENLWVRTQI